MPDLPLAIEVMPHENSTLRLLRLSGPLTLSNLFEFQSLVRAEDSRATIIDMTSVPYVDSAGIGCLIGAHVSHQRTHRRLALVGVCDALHPNIEEAVTAFARAAQA